MLLTRENGTLKLFADRYRLEIPTDRPFIYLDSTLGHRIADLNVLSSVHSRSGDDDTTVVEPWQVEEGIEETVFILKVSSSVWDRKVYRITCTPDRIRYEIEVHGSGNLTEVKYFGGYSSASTRWGTGFFPSGQRFLTVFNPEPDTDEIYTHQPETTTAINLTGVPLPGKADWFFTPAPYCFVFEVSMPGDRPQDSWMSAGLEALPGENRYTEFSYHGMHSAFYLDLAYDGKTVVNGAYRLPAIGFDFGPDPYTLLNTHVQQLRVQGLAYTPLTVNRPDWWSEPIFCGWGAQCHLAHEAGGRAPDFAVQENYEQFLSQLADHSIFPGTVVIDDKWQLHYGENDVDPQKWPDLPGFVQNCHERGQQVLMWLKAWDAQGVPPEECITNAAGLPLAVDPTNPRYVERLRASVRRMLSPDGYNADGFKIDFSARIPTGPGMNVYGEAWGLELMRVYLQIIHDEACRVKADAFIITHTPHPYLADLVGAIRLNDINTQHDINKQMVHRAKIASIACPEALIDMDNWPIRDKQTWRDYLSQRPMLGIPALYFASHVDSTQEAFDDDDYALLRETWAEYRASLINYNPSPAEIKASTLGGVSLTGSTSLTHNVRSLHA